MIEVGKNWHDLASTLCMAGTLWAVIAGVDATVPLGLTIYYQVRAARAEARDHARMTSNR